MHKTGQEALDVLKHLMDKADKLQREMDALDSKLTASGALNNDNNEDINQRINALKAQVSALGVDYSQESKTAEKRLEDLLKDIDAKHPKSPAKIMNTCNTGYYPTYEELIEIAHQEGVVNSKIEDLLTPEEIAKADAEYDALDKQFSEKTWILNKKDLTFLAIATALQVVRWILAPEVGDTIDQSTRMDDKAGDQSVKQEKHDYNESHSSKMEGDWESKASEKYRSWQEIVFSSVPYDAIVGAQNFGLNFEGRYHRVHTLGHDPILGWFFGTLNILTLTLTTPNFRTFNISKKGNAFINETSLLEAFKMCYESLNEDIHKLPAAVFRQYLHIKSDAQTKLGLPIPLLEVFSETLASDLYKSQYDSLCLLKDAKTVASSAIISIITDMIIGLAHSYYYDESKDHSKQLYEVRTRKILLIAHILASTSNIIYCIITKNPKKLDIGGLIVTVGRLFLDLRFIRIIKHEFINSKLDKELLMEIEKLNAIEATL